MTTNYQTRDGDMVDEICFKHYGAINGYINSLYEANPMIAKYPVKLPAGITIVLPEVEITEEISLW